MTDATLGSSINFLIKNQSVFNLNLRFTGGKFICVANYCYMHMYILFKEALNVVNLQLMKYYSSGDIILLI